MIAVFPFHTADAANAIDLLRWCEQLGGCKAHNALLVADAATPFKQCAEAKKIASRCFAEVRCIANPESTQGWPQGPNSLFHAAAKYIEAAWTQPWINLETDAIPLRPGWLDKIEVEYREHKALFMGDVYNGLHSSTGMPIRALSGVCVYPPDAGTLLKHDPAVPWDMLNREMMLERSHATQLIKHLYGERNLPPTFVESKGSGSPRNAFTLDDIRRDAVLFHRNKDGSLLRLLRKRIGFVEKKDLLVVFPFCKYDVSQLVDMLQWMRDLSKWKEYDALLSYEIPISNTLLAKVRDSARDIFGNVYEHPYQLKLRGWLPTLAWLETANYIQKTFKRPWLWFEFDMIPLKPNWLDVIQGEYERAQKPFMGPIVKDYGHCNGTAVYPADASAMLPSTMRAVSTAWDVAMKNEMIDKCHDCGHLLQHAWVMNNGKLQPHGGGPAPSFADPAMMDQIYPTAVLFHRCKDGSLITRLRQRRNES